MYADGDLPLNATFTKPLECVKAEAESKLKHNFYSNEINLMVDYEGNKYDLSSLHKLRLLENYPKEEVDMVGVEGKIFKVKVENIQAMIPTIYDGLMSKLKQLEDKISHLYSLESEEEVAQYMSKEGK